MKTFIRAQARFRWSVVISAALIGIIALGGIQWVAAQQQMTWVPTAAPNTGLLNTVTTALTATAVVPTFLQGNSQTLNRFTGTHNIYGYNAANTTNNACFVQVFDRELAAVTVGTTVPELVIPLPPVNATTTVNSQWTYISPLPMGMITSTLSFAATNTPTGSGGCTGGLGVFVSLSFK